MYAVTLRSLAHDALRRALRLAVASAVLPLVVDGTAGNGHDTLFLAQQVGEGGQVWAFDVQEAALTATRARVQAGGVGHRVRCVLDGHQCLHRYLPAEAPLHGAMFNLGYLPGASRDVVTEPKNTLAALEAVSQRMVSGSVLSVHIYTGHEGGEAECAVLLAWANALLHPQWQVLHIHTANKPQRAEHLLLIART